MGESRWMKIIGKPYSGKLNVRFDEGELEIEPLATTPALYSTEAVKIRRETDFRNKNKDFFLKSCFWHYPSESANSNGNQQNRRIESSHFFLDIMNWFS